MLILHVISEKLKFIIIIIIIIIIIQSGRLKGKFCPCVIDTFRVIMAVIMGEVN